MKKENRDVFITSDNKVFTDQHLAAKHELKTRLATDLGITAGNVQVVILDNMTNLRTILNDILGE